MFSHTTLIASLSFFKMFKRINMNALMIQSSQEVQIIQSATMNEQKSIFKLQENVLGECEGAPEVANIRRKRNINSQADLNEPERKRPKFLKSVFSQYNDENEIILPSWAGIAFAQECLQNYMEEKQAILKSYKDKRPFRRSCIQYSYFKIDIQLPEMVEEYNEFLYFRNLIQPLTNFVVRPSDIKPFYDKFGRFNASAIVRIPDIQEPIKRVANTIQFGHSEIRSVSISTRTSFRLQKEIENKMGEKYRVLIKNLPVYCTIECIKTSVFQNIFPKETIKVNDRNWIFVMDSQQDVHRILFYDGEVFDSAYPPISIEQIYESDMKELLERIEVPDILDSEREKARKGIYLFMRKGLTVSRNDIPTPEKLKVNIC